MWQCVGCNKFIIGLVKLFCVQKSNQKPPDSERSPSQDQPAPAGSVAPPTTQDQPISPAAEKKINLGEQSLIFICLHVHTHTYTDMIIVH